MKTESGARSGDGAGYGYVLVAAALWALITPGARFLIERGIAPAEIAYWRCLMGAVLFGGIAALRRRPLAIRRGDVPGVVAFGIFGVAGLYLALPLAVAAGGAALASILLYTAPAWVALLSWRLFHERLDGRKLLALIVTLAGVAAIATGTATEIRVDRAAIGWGLLSGLLYASLYLFGKVFFARYAAERVYFWALLLAATVLLPITSFTRKLPPDWIVLGTLGVLSTYGAYVAYAAGLVRLEASRAAITATLEPVLAGAIAFALWGERFAFRGYVGAAMVVGAVLLLAAQPEGIRPEASRRGGSVAGPDRG